MSPENSNPSPEDQPDESAMPRLIRIVVFIVSLHLIFFGGLLIQGCKKNPTEVSGEPEGVTKTSDEEILPQVDTEYYTQYETNLLNPITDFPPLEAEPVDDSQTQSALQTSPGVDMPPTITNDPVVPRMTTPHTVEKGETFYGIAKKYKVSLKAVLNANPDINPQALRPGMTVEIPPQEPPSLEAEAVLDDGSTYRVRKGDSLYKIASMHQVTVDALMKENNLKSSVIHPDQRLKIPKLKGAQP